MTKALAEFNMIEEGDKVLVCVSGGKDSSILLALLTDIQKRAPINFTIEAAILDQKQPGFDATDFKVWVESLGVKLHVIERDTYSIVIEKTEGNTYCALCSKFRRAILYDFAFDHGFTKLALGHHQTDAINTALLNLLYIGTWASMPPKLRSDDGRNILIRPLIFVAEEELTALSETWKFPVIPCNLCGSQEGLKRQKMKQLVKNLKQDIPNIEASIMSALGRTRPSQLFDQKLFNFKDLKPMTPLAPNNHFEDTFKTNLKKTDCPDIKNPLV